MNMFGVSGNLMSLGALDFGLIVDGAVIIVEACCLVYTAGKRLKLHSKDVIPYRNVNKMRNVSVFGVDYLDCIYSILLCVVLKEKCFANGTNYCICIIWCFILSLTYVPMMTALFFE
jgi:cobalt-zinc-cadmium resistance protein CzcA